MVERANIDASSQRIDLRLSIQTRRGLLQRGTQCPLCRSELATDVSRVTIRHFNLGPMRIFLDVPEYHQNAALRPACACARRWRRPESRYSLNFERMVQRAIEAGLDRSGLRDVFALSAEESAAFIDLMTSATRSGQSDTGPNTGRSSTSILGRPPALELEVEVVERRPEATTPVRATTANPDKPAIPPLEAPCWAALLRGQLAFRTESVSLVMLVERLRLSLSGGDPGRESAAIASIHEYFQRHARNLPRELAQLQQTAVSAAPNRRLPPIDHPAWVALIEGRIPVRSDALGLQMLLERVRLTLGENPAPALKQAASRTVFDFFVRHGQRHQPELASMQGLRAAHEQWTHEAASRELPPESDPVWLRIIRGEVDASRASLPLQLLLQRLRSELGPDASQRAELQAVRTLRSFYLRAQGSQPRALVSAAVGRTRNESPN